AGLAGLAVWRIPRTSSPGTDVRADFSPVMTVRASLHGQWADGREVVVGSGLAADVWAWQSGLIELVTRDGTVLLVEAPAAVEMVNPLYVRLISGNVVVRMPKGRSGFVVETPDMKVFDLGTEFGVSASFGGESKVQVFDGKVRAETADMAIRKEVTVGETVRTDGKGGLLAEKSDADRFIRRFPLDPNPQRACGVLYSRSTVEAVRVAPATRPVVLDGDLAEWNWRVAFKSACDAPYAEAYWLEGMMMYDSTNLYLAAHVGDPDPLRNVAPKGFEFAGGSVIVRVSMDKAQGWPLKGTMFVDGAYDCYRKRISSETRDRRVTSIVMWHDLRAQRARIRLEHGIDQHDKRDDPPGGQGVFRKDLDGCGYTLEYAIPWRLLNCADDPPRGGDELAALWMVHWSDTDGRIARGQLVEVTNHRPHPQDKIPPYLYFQNGPSWGRAVYLRENE
ncbi:MAG: FecR domain-containing protein, partial [Kiritimatiellia bacterium]|nr:FecR domain-containing protein [Kiritimatiellia bacterium]